MINVKYFGATDVGLVRGNNEDVYIAMPLWDQEHFLLAAIDGMGGEEGGEVASATARDAMISYLENHREGDDRTLIREAMAFANNEIIRAKETAPHLGRMGCVATAGILDARAATLSIAHVGDSRLYLCSHGEITKLTHDHSLVGYQEEQGYLTEEEAMHHPARSVIERCLGMEPHNADDPNFIESNLFYVDPGDIFLFCSDGVCDMITKAQIKECLMAGSTPEEECRLIIETSKDAGGKDNITAVVAKVEGEGSGAARTVTASATASSTEATAPMLDVTAEDEKPGRSKGKRILWGILYTLVVAGAAALITIGIVKQRQAQEEGADQEGTVMPTDSVTDSTATQTPTLQTPAPEASQDTTPRSQPTSQPSSTSRNIPGVLPGNGNPTQMMNEDIGGDKKEKTGNAETTGEKPKVSESEESKADPGTSATSGSANETGNQAGNNETKPKTEKTNKPKAHEALPSKKKTPPSNPPSDPTPTPTPETP